MEMAKFIVIDGLDGCGKATQTELLRQELEKRGKKVVKIDFPKYDSDSSAAVRMYLNGELGDNPEELNPYMCGTFYAVDRFIQYMTDWKKYFEEDDNTIVIADRYLSANIIHQGGKIESKSERDKYIKWCYTLECNLCGLPVEDATIILKITPEVSQKLMSERYNEDETKKDIHENNVEYLKDCYNRLQETLTAIRERVSIPSQWCSLDCSDMEVTDNNKTTFTLATREKIHHNVMMIVDKILNGESVNGESYTCYFEDSQYNM
jgi:dTMP kinase